jgi:hypothetical protein
VHNVHMFAQYRPLCAMVCISSVFFCECTDFFLTGLSERANLAITPPESWEKIAQQDSIGE